MKWYRRLRQHSADVFGVEHDHDAPTRQHQLHSATPELASQLLHPLHRARVRLHLLQYSHDGSAPRARGMMQ